MFIRAAIVAAALYASCIGLPARGGPATAPSTAPSTAPAAPAKKHDRVIFVFDARGEMLNQRDDAKREINKAIEQLKPGQLFNVVISRDKGPELFKKQLMPATAANVKAAADYLSHVEVEGTSGLEGGVAAAVRFRPDVVWLVANGNIDAKSLAAVRKANPGARVRLNTLVRFALPAYAREDSAKALHTLWQIAHDNSGACIDDDGKAIDEPNAVAPPAKDRPPTAPSIFRE